MRRKHKLALRGQRAGTGGRDRQEGSPEGLLFPPPTSGWIWRRETKSHNGNILWCFGGGGSNRWLPPLPGTQIDLVNLDRRLENPCQGEQCTRVEGQDGAAPEPRDAHGPEDNQALTLSTRCKGPRGRGTQAGLLSLKSELQPGHNDGSARKHEVRASQHRGTRPLRCPQKA